MTTPRNRGPLWPLAITGLFLVVVVVVVAAVGALYQAARDRAALTVRLGEVEADLDGLRERLYQVEGDVNTDSQRIGELSNRLDKLETGGE